MYSLIKNANNRSDHQTIFNANWHLNALLFPCILFETKKKTGQTMISPSTFFDLTKKQKSNKKTITGI